MNKPKETCPSFRRGHLPSYSDVKRLRLLSGPHVKSFDYFLEYGLQAGVADIIPMELDIVDNKARLANSEKQKKKDDHVTDSEDDEDDNPGDDDSHNNYTDKDNFNQREQQQQQQQKQTKQIYNLQMWIENVHISKPIQKDTHISSSMPSSSSLSSSLSASARYATASKLIPRHCREMGINYAGAMTGDLCFQINQRTVTTRHTNTLSMTEHPGKVHRLHKHFGNIPIMVMSQSCHLHNSRPEDLVKLKEEDNEFGGYFIVNGNERCVRLLQVPRCNHPTAIQRNAYKNRGPTFTDLGIAIRCARHNGDMTSVTNTLHYLTTGGATLKFTARKQEFLIPVILLLRALSYPSNITDEEIYNRILRGDENNTFLKARAQLLLQESQRFTSSSSLHTSKECLAFLGSRFRYISGKADSTTDTQVGQHIIDRYILIHLNSLPDKLECLLHLMRKLYSFVAGDCCVDNADSLQNQELLLPGHLISKFVKEKFEEILLSIRTGINKELRINFNRTAPFFSTTNFDLKAINKLIDKYSTLSSSGAGAGAGGIGQKVAFFLNTGNIVTSTGLDLMQISGYTIVAERLNFLRYCAHFRSVHRGQFFMEMKTTAVRKLLPDQWGFLCPVHTPDGGPCGLLSHLSLKCLPMTHPAPLIGGNMKDLDELLISMGISPAGTGGPKGDGKIAMSHQHLTISLDGRVLGGASPKLCRSIAFQLRQLKVAEFPTVPPTLEVALIPPGIKGGPYPGLYLFTTAARMVRPVLNRSTGKMELIGPMEQPFMEIACLPEDIHEGITTHQEIEPTNMLSLIASLTPFSDYNQSPRNMYQCQMGKQTMGTPCHSLPHRADNKLYRLQTPQAPIAQTARHGEFKMDEYPNGTNAVVAVLSYTGFDMEDAMILNKSSYERGFGHASVYKTVKVDLLEEAKHMKSDSGIAGYDKAKLKFTNKAPKQSDHLNHHNHNNSLSSPNAGGTLCVDDKLHHNLGQDGLPEVGTWVKEGDALYCYVDELTNKTRVGKHKEKETACIQHVRLLGKHRDPQNKSIGANGYDEKLSITLRTPRNPVIGDKFSSRHGQKGVLSILWPHTDMPFSESGISPDVIINPHAFPSRMTIGMLIESMAGKSGALHGMFQDSSPFSFHESGDKIAVDYFGEQLQAAGYSYYGSEPLYSGVSGCLMHADLYIGVVYYQRLRHMVSDKYQVRATGPVNSLTRQPIKGRKKGGGVRLGEMERDSLLSHGAAYIMLDRLLNSSDRHISYACRRCGDLLSSATEKTSVPSIRGHGRSAFRDKYQSQQNRRVYCRNPLCRNKTREGGNDDMVEPIILPYVYRYLANELAAMNIKMKMSID
eukprot:CAMPEP_0184857366 /NCGR_PEP_ID=MMETSP0580-20130426/2536_1 /TAXON_ID=1118495 /ORGANISM="Dactyliosolen fragilissimus" /LENGTH=1332 /DNA_ID=CAMNT_0027352931 /DNA_START=45 /DNA_END=4043 /DNA_ORIENTATION=-